MLARRHFFPSFFLGAFSICLNAAFDGADNSDADLISKIQEGMTHALN